MNNIKTIRQPKDIMDAQYSLAWGCAVRFYRGGNGLHDYREQDLSDPRFAEFAGRVSFSVDPVCDEERLRLKNRSAVVTVVTRDGKRLEKRVQFSKGHPRNPMTDAELTAKFHASVGPILGEARSREIADMIWRIETVAEPARLLALTLK